MFFFFIFNDTATTEIYTDVPSLALHDALPIYEHLEGRTCIVGETRTIADISAWGWLGRASRVSKGAEDPLESFPDLKATILGFGARRDSMKVFERNAGRSEERSVGKWCVSKCRYRGWPYN